MFKTEKKISFAIKKTTCIVDFNNENEIDKALKEAENTPFISFNKSYNDSQKYLESLTN